MYAFINRSMFGTAEFQESRGMFHLKELMKFKEKDWDLSEVGCPAGIWVILGSLG